MSSPPVSFRKMLSKRELECPPACRRSYTTARAAPPAPSTSAVRLKSNSGAATRMFFSEKLHVVSHVAYLLLGVVALVALKPLVATVPQGALWLLLAGGLCYACGTVFHLWERMRYHQVARHAFALGGSACHLIAVLMFVLPHAG